MNRASLAAHFVLFIIHQRKRLHHSFFIKKRFLWGKINQVENILLVCFWFIYKQHFNASFCIVLPGVGICFENTSKSNTELFSFCVLYCLVYKGVFAAVKNPKSST